MLHKKSSSQEIGEAYCDLFPEAIPSDQRKRQSYILSRHVLVEVRADKEDSVEESVREIFKEWEKDPDDTYSVEELQSIRFIVRNVSSNKNSPSCEGYFLFSNLAENENMFVVEK